MTRAKIHFNPIELEKRYLVVRSTRKLAKIYDVGAITIQLRLKEYGIPRLPAHGQHLAPGQWARLYDRCVECGTDEEPHYALGRCNRCYFRLKWNERQERNRK